MGDPRKTKKKFERPKHPWKSDRIDSERELKKQYGLRNNKEIWRMKSILRKKRKNARELLALPLEQRLKREKELMESMHSLGFLEKEATLDDVLSLNTEAVMERRLQTLVTRQGLANTALQARQFITHGHIAIEGERITSPSYLVRRKEEKSISYYGKPIELAPKVLKAGEKKPEKVLSAKEELKKKFEEAKPVEAGEEEGRKGAEVAGEEVKAVEEPKAEEVSAGEAEGKGEVK